MASAGVGVLYWRSADCLDAFFHFDDFWVLRAADAIALRSLADIGQIFAPIHGFLLYRPLSTLAYFYALRVAFGHDPVAYHFVQMAFQVLNGLIVFLLADRLLLNRLGAVVVAVLYLLAPGHAIAACWNALFTMTGAAFFYFLGLLAWTGIDGRARGPLTVLCFALTLLSSEHGVTFPVAISAATLFLYPRVAWRHAAWAQVVMYVGAIAYAGYKIYYIRAVVPVTVQDPIVRGIIQKTYAPHLDSTAALQNLGSYLGFSLNGLYDVLLSRPGLRIVAAGVWAAWWAAAMILCGVPVSGQRLWRVAAFGLTLFAIALAPVLFLPNHVYSYYIGIAAAGLAVALVATASTLPIPSILPPLLVLGLAAALFFPTTMTLRNSEELRFFWSFSRSAARWLYSVSVSTPNRGVEEVVVPQDGVTDMVFREGEAQRVLLCGHYEVRRVADFGREPAAPHRIFIREPLPLTRSAQRPWGWLMRACRH